MQNMFNFKVVPSPKYPSSGNGSYYNGGYNTATYSSIAMAQYRINGIQIEITSQLRFGLNATIIGTANKIAASIYQFYIKNSFDKKRA